MGLHHQFDGEFWMEFFGDFCKEFEEVNREFRFKKTLWSLEEIGEILEGV